MSAGDRLFYFPTHEEYGRPETYGLSYESVHFAAQDGPRLHGWFFPAKGAARGTVVHCHGNAGNITGHFEHVRWLPSQGWNVLCFDYRGYGRSEGRPTRQGTVDDALASVHYAGSRDDVDSDRIVLLGQSLGGSIGIVVTADMPLIRGLAVDGAFSNYRVEAAFVGRQNLLLRPVAELLSRSLVSAGLDPINHVASIAPRPSFFVCGTDDRIVDYRQTVALYEAAGEPKQLWVIENGGHTDCLRESEGRQRLVDFFDACLNGSGSG